MVAGVWGAERSGGEGKAGRARRKVLTKRGGGTCKRRKESNGAETYAKVIRRVEREREGQEMR